MAFLKYAKAKVIQAGIGTEVWKHVQRASSVRIDKVASRIDFEEFDPKKYLLSHVTIMASVDTENVSGGVLGKSMFEGFQIDRRFPDFHITPATEKYINHNHDAWERKLLLSSFKTFIGASNFVEHLQIPELNKGRIIDAAARDIGESVYIDILVATDRKHKALVASIQSGELNTLSMGCSVRHTTCTKCGNVAEDETLLCPHIKFMKGKTFLDTNGIQRKIAEICGHVTDEPGSVTFIEASWVGNPAFKGAVLRSFLVPSEAARYGDKVRTTFSSLPPVPNLSVMQKAAAQFGDNPTEDLGEAKEEPKEDPLQKAIDDLVGVIRERAIEQVRRDIGEDEVGRIHDTSEVLNDTLIKSALLNPSWQKLAGIVLGLTRSRVGARKLLLGLIHHKAGSLALAGLSGKDLLALSRVLNILSKKPTIAGETRLYKTAINVGGLSTKSSKDAYLRACKAEIGRDLTEVEKQRLIVLAQLLDGETMSGQAR